MRYDDLWIKGTGSYLGELRPVAPDIAAGRYAEKDAREAGTVSVSTADLAPPEMAVRAGRDALAAAGTTRPSSTLHLHGSTYFQGLDMWPAACWIAGQLLGETLDTLSMQASALSNSSLACLELAGSLLAGRPDLSGALLTCADRFAPPGVDRWNIDSGMAFGDGAAAAVLGRGGGALRVLSVVSYTDTSLEGLQRGDEAFHPVSPTALETLPMRRRAREFFAQGTMAPKEARQRSVDAVQRVVTAALDEAGCSIGEARWVVPPFVGRRLFESGFVEPLGLDPERTLFEFGLTTGHLGSVDQLLSLDHLLGNGLLRPGDRVVLIGTGMGFTFTCAVLTA
ncbi:3-oxoacyl-ACP synthase [Streptomyces inhibens]|uniref:3-oxoacyl-ACP synthase n=1 Tax=Streptomyces inhibens TaxID=2293571 RepID=A0A371Q565_STRIH|nr:ketoacyl-ACP synthase III family protein [Streptomyces inhibens]REK89812.1 3-oxoacyl-ACP synthase [Streptomyces inhibens]